MDFNGKLAEVISCQVKTLCNDYMKDINIAYTIESPLAINFQTKITPGQGSDSLIHTSISFVKERVKDHTDPTRLNTAQLDFNFNVESEDEV